MTVCEAANAGTTEELPLKEKKTKIRQRYFHYLYIETPQETFLQKRTNKDIWQHLYEPPLIENDHEMQMAELLQHPTFQTLTHNSGNVKIIKDLDANAYQYDLLIVEDILDSGNTLSKVIDILKTRNPRSLKVCALLDKPDRRKSHVDLDYKGFEIPDEFIVGYGLDYDEKYRNLPYIGVLKNTD
jgi:hypoxanthine phosphoribosyltransferase